MWIGRTKGFTLVEMIVAIVIAAFLGTVVYTTFAQGVRIWTRVAKDRGEWKVDLWVEKMTGDLRNSFQDPRWTFKGTRTELSFATLFPDRNGEGEGSPAYFHYVFDSKAHALISQRYAFEDVLMSNSESKAVTSTLDNVVAFDLEYYAYDVKARAYRWQSQWNKDCFPETVKITIEPEKMNQHKWVRMISIPTEKVCPE